MDIDITRFFNDAEAYNFSASVAERGENAGRETWENAVREGTDSPLLTTVDQLDALRDHVRGYGAWEDEVIACWSDAECNALFIQLVSGDMREIESLCTNDNGEVNWRKYEKLSREGTINGLIFRANDGRIYYTLGS